MREYLEIFRRSLQEKVNNKEIIINMTDKSGRLSVDKLENYI